PCRVYTGNCRSCPGTIARSDELFRVREICEIPTGRLAAHAGPDLFPNVVLRLSNNRPARSPAVRLDVLFRAVLRPNAGAARAFGYWIEKKKVSWRRGWDSNPRARFWQATRFRGGLFQPLRHLSPVEV